jgi:hypothetical protein
MADLIEQTDKCALTSWAVLTIVGSLHLGMISPRREKQLLKRFAPV